MYFVGKNSYMNFWQNFSQNRLLVDASIWSADVTRLGGEIARVDEMVDLYHFDASDAHFVPGLLLYPDLLAGLRPLSRKPFHVHLMVDAPLPLIDDFARAGADMITVHAAAGGDPANILQYIRKARLAAGLGFGLDADVEGVIPYLDQIDLVLLMGTPMGIKGQDLSPLACPRIRRMQTILQEHGCARKVKIEADGGIRRQTVPLLTSAGADLIVPGSLLFKNDDLDGTFRWLGMMSRTASRN